LIEYLEILLKIKIYFMYSLTGKVALVTGAGSGIGKETALLYGRSGASVVVSGRNKERCDAVTQAIIMEGGKAATILADVSNDSDCKYLIEETVRLFGKIDIACNNAGALCQSHPLAEFTVEEYRRIIETNIDGVFYCMRHEIPAMLSNNGGVIINLSSIVGQTGMYGIGPYVASKHAVEGLTKCAALEYSDKGIRVLSVGPGSIITPMLDAFSVDEKKMLVSAHPIGRLGQPVEVAEAIVWLSTSAASFITGTHIGVDGAFLAR
jgi:NAD(P)-dependent dehydrogenase (short-subunit alcohol dehydrogenase family)